jgi:hypothetical protein
VEKNFAGGGDQFLRRNRTSADQHLLKPAVGPAILAPDSDPGSEFRSRDCHHPVAA